MVEDDDDPENYVGGRVTWMPPGARWPGAVQYREGFKPKVKEDPQSAPPPAGGDQAPPRR